MFELFIILLGIGYAPKIALVAITVFFPVENAIGQWKA